MRTLHVPFSYFPSPAGGTEVYVAALANALRTHGITSIVAAPGDRDETYEWAGVSVHRFKTSASAGLEDLYGEGDAAAAASFGCILNHVRPDLVHFHALTAGASVLAMREVKSRRIPLIFTYHTPTVSCVRGTMMKWGKIPCDGKMNSGICAACALHGKGVPRLLALGLAKLSPSALYQAGKALKKGRMATAMQFPALIRRRHQATHTVFDLADRLVAVCAWVRDVLSRNGVAPGKIEVSRQGLPGNVLPLSSGDSGQRPIPNVYSLAFPLRLAFFGRLDPTKGIHIVVAALRANRDLPVVLDIFGIAQGPSGEVYRAHLARSAAGDARIRFHAPLESSTVVERMRHYDLVLVPSLCLETGPLVVYEAQAAGVPVLGSRLGGIAELVVDDQTGRTLAAGDVREWAAELGRLVGRPEIIERWKDAQPRPRTMADAAADMATLYANVRTF